ncbi:MAG: exopolyphosphatase, partial [Nitrospirota bacterium]
MSLLASIDVGSNTFRLLIGEVADTGIVDVFSDRKVTRLGEGLDKTGGLQEKNMRDSLAALREFASSISRYGVADVRAVATSALREASNAQTFIQQVYDHTGIPIEVITGSREAELTLKGILFSFSRAGIHGSHFIVDIGGGSTECILCRDERVIFMESIPVGVIKFTGLFLRSDPPSEKDIADLNSEIISILNSLNARVGRYMSPDTGLVGTAGTFSTLASIDL